MKRIIKSKTFIFFILACLIGSFILIFINLSQIQKYRINKRNEQRKQDIDTITTGIKNYITNNNNLPTISNLDQNSFLPELIFVEKQPAGGISIQSLENIEGYFDLSLKDPMGNPYFIGTSDELVVIYTQHFEVYNSANQTYFKYLKIKSENSGKITAEEVKE